MNWASPRNRHEMRSWVNQTGAVHSANCSRAQKIVVETQRGMAA